MALLLAKCYSKLPLPERLRLQKLLRVILPQNNSQPIVFSRLLRESYDRLEAYPSKWLVKRGLLASFQKLLEHFGFLSAKQLSPKEKKKLYKNPYVVWPNEEYCTVVSDALPLLVQDRKLNKQNYLCLILQALHLREKKAWRQWLKLDLSPCTEKEWTIYLYHRLAYLQEVQRDCCEILMENGTLMLDGQAIPQYLEDVFPNDLHDSPVAWFYHGVLPLYSALHQVEDRADKLTALARAVLLYMKSGRLVALPISKKSSSSSRWQLVLTKERRLADVLKIPSFDFFSNTEEKQGEMLF